MTDNNYQFICQNLLKKDSSLIGKQSKRDKNKLCLTL
jgi:hypothetical protein